MAFELKTEFDSLEDAIAYLKSDVAGAIGGLETEKNKLIAKRDELLAEIRKTKDKYAKFSKHADQDIDIDELLRIKEQSESSTTDIEAKYRTAYEQDKKKLEARLEAIERERAQEKEQAQKQEEEAKRARLRADAIAEFSKESHRIRNPEQFWILFGQGKIQRTDEGKLVVGDDYKQQSLGEYVKAIADDESNLHHFKPSGASGSGTGSGTGGGGATKVNPWNPKTRNLTMQGQILRQNPELAKRLEAEAKAMSK